MKDVSLRICFKTELPFKKLRGLSEFSEARQLLLSRLCKDFMAAAAPLGCDFVPSLRCAMDSAWVYFGLFPGNFDGIRFLHGWFANFTPDCAHFGWDVDFYFTPDCAHFCWDMVFQQTSCSTATSVTSVLFATSSLRWRPRQHFSWKLLQLWLRPFFKGVSDFCPFG